jgi:subtilisin family serine protease
MKSIYIITLFFILFTLGINIHESNNRSLSSISSKEPCNLKKVANSLLRGFNINKFPVVDNYSPKIAVIDTGLDYKNTSFKNKIFLPNSVKTSEINYGLDTSGFVNSNTPVDTHGHGSHIAGIILAINPNAKILPIKYYNPQHSGERNLSSFFKAIQFAIDSNVDIINISGGGSFAVEKELSLIKKAEEKGILIITALGNESSDVKIKPYFPAYYAEKNILSVMSHDNNFNKTYFSNWGEISKISTYGTNIMSFGLSKISCYISLSGTSQSTAIITGVASLIKGTNEKLNYKDIKDFIQYSSRDSNKKNLSRVFMFDELNNILINSNKKH